MLTDGTEEREFLYAADCCQALHKVMHHYDEFTSDDDLHITSFNSSSILDVANIIVDEFAKIGKVVKITPTKVKDTVQQDKRNKPNEYIKKWWVPKSTLEFGISQVFKEMKKEYEN